MNLRLLQRAASVVIGTCLELDADDELLVIDDGTYGYAVGDAFGVAAEASGISAVHLHVTPTEYIPMREFGRFAKASLETLTKVLPTPALEAARHSDGVVLLTSDLNLLFDRDFRSLVESNSVPFVWLPYIDAERFVRLAPNSSTQARRLASETAMVGRIVREGGAVHITSPQGTELEFHLNSYTTNVSTGMPGSEAGYAGLELIPGGQVARVPDPGSVNGRLVIDGSVNAPEYEQVDEPIGLDVHDGTVNSITGGVVGDKLRRFLRAVDLDGEAYNLTEFGLGTNPACRQTAQAGPAEDTHQRGCVSFAIGADVHLGGITKAACHVDMTMREATVTIDGRVVVQDGQPAWGEVSTTNGQGSN